MSSVLEFSLISVIFPLYLLIRSLPLFLGIICSKPFLEANTLSNAVVGHSMNV